MSKLIIFISGVPIEIEDDFKPIDPEIGKVIEDHLWEIM